MSFNINLANDSIETDRALAEILGNFSEEYIQDLLQQAFIWKFRPFENAMPNYVYIFNQYYNDIKAHYTGPSPELIDEDRIDTFINMINIICNNYQLQADIANIPAESLYTVAYMLYQLLLSEFTDKLVGFFTNYILSHGEELVNSLSEEKRNIKSSFSKKVYYDPIQIAIYENMTEILDNIASLDIPMYDLIRAISDDNTANFLTMYVADIGDLYKNHFASYIYNPATRTQMITKIKLSFVQGTSDKMNILNGEDAINPFGN